MKITYQEETYVHKIRFDKRQTTIKIIFAFLYAIFIVLGDIDNALTRSVGQNILRLMGWWLAAFVVLTLACLILDHRRARVVPIARLEKRFYRDYMYLVFAAICLLGWLPYFLLYFPGWVSNDSVWQLEQACGWVSASNHHPYAHTLIIKCFFMLGYRIFGTYTGAAAFYVFFQMVFMAAVYALVPYHFYKKGIHNFYIALTLLFYALLPINGLYSICMSKDALFSAVLLLYAWQTWKIAESLAPADTASVLSGQMTDARRRRLKRTLSKENRDAVLYFISGLAVCLLRSNGIFVFLGTSVCLAVKLTRLIGALRKSSGIRTEDASDRATAKLTSAIVKVSGLSFDRTWKKYLFSMAGVLLCYLLWQGPVLKALDVEQPDTIEGLTMPTQHLLSAYLNGGTLTEDELAMMNAVVPMDQVATYYNPYFFDIVKEFIRSEGNQEVIAEHKWEYFQLWLKVGLRNPRQYLEAEVKQTLGYWAASIPDYQYLYEQYLMAENPFEMTTQRKVFSYDFSLKVDDFLLRFQEFYNKVWSLGLNTWLLVAAFFYAVYRRKTGMLYVPYVMLLVSLLLATPAYSEFRYVYGLFAALPLLICDGFERQDGRVRIDGNIWQNDVSHTAGTHGQEGTS
jgi:hypothetical protein